ncbi:Microsomal glutathione S-transferase 1 [Dinochytrium kinnereticum]|nr:Microsomal glutathione S-transferase 1 [Dinochytrium kinnereticum]
MASSSVLSLANPVFKTYATTSTLLLAKCVGLSLSVVVARLWNNSYGTPEDRIFPYILNLVTGGRWAPTKTIKDVKQTDVIITSESGYTHPVVKRISACHANDVENTSVLVLLGALYVTVAKPSAAEASRVFWTLVAARYSHAAFYVFGVQPFRALAFIAGGVTGMEMAVRVLGAL